MGSATLSILQLKMTKGSVGMSGNVHAGLFLGLDAEAEYEKTVKAELASAGLPGFSIPKVLTVGPVVSLAAELDLGIKGQGQFLVGMAMDIPNFAATLDLVDSSNSASSGFTPVFTRNFSAKGEISATAGLGLPLSIGVGVDASIINFKKTIALIEKPAISAVVQYSGSTSSAKSAVDFCPNGLRYALSLSNDVYIDFFGEKVISLFPYHPPPLAQSCFQ